MPTPLGSSPVNVGSIQNQTAPAKTGDTQISGQFGHRSVSLQNPQSYLPAAPDALSSQPAGKSLSQFSISQAPAQPNFLDLIASDFGNSPSAGTDFNNHWDASWEEDQEITMIDFLDDDEPEVTETTDERPQAANPEQPAEAPAPAEAAPATVAAEPEPQATPAPEPQAAVTTTEPEPAPVAQPRSVQLNPAIETFEYEPADYHEELVSLCQEGDLEGVVDNLNALCTDIDDLRASARAVASEGLFQGSIQGAFNLAAINLIALKIEDSIVENLASRARNASGFSNALEKTLASDAALLSEIKGSIRPGSDAAGMAQQWLGDSVNLNSLAPILTSRVGERLQDVASEAEFLYQAMK